MFAYCHRWRRQYGQMLGGGNKTFPQRGIGGKGWHKDSTWNNNVKIIKSGGTVENLNGVDPTETEGRFIITEAGGHDVVKHDAHPYHSRYGYVNKHTYLHLHYYTLENKKGILRIKE